MTDVIPIYLAVEDSLSEIALRVILEQSGKKSTGIAEKEVTLGRERSLIFQRVGGGCEE